MRDQKQIAKFVSPSTRSSNNSITSFLLISSRTHLNQPSRLRKTSTFPARAERGVILVVIVSLIGLGWGRIIMALAIPSRSP
jgi:hypothetical protein